MYVRGGTSGKSGKGGGVGRESPLGRPRLPRRTRLTLRSAINMKGKSTSGTAWINAPRCVQITTAKKRAALIPCHTKKMMMDPVVLWVAAVMSLSA